MLSSKPAVGQRLKKNKRQWKNPGQNQSSSSDTLMSNLASTRFIETREYRRLVEFCEASCRDRYIGLCYGAPGVGKTLSARHYVCWDIITSHRPLCEKASSQLRKIAGSHVAFYTPQVVNSPPD